MNSNWKNCVTAMQQPARAGLVAALFVLATSAIAGAQQPPARIVVAEAVAQDVAPTSSFVATMTPVKRVVIGSAVDGRVYERNVEAGDRVEKGQPLIQLLTDTIGLELKSAQAELSLRHFELAELENGSRPDEMAQAKAKMLAAHAHANYARSQLKRYQGLIASRAISQDELDQSESEFDQASQVFLDLKAAYQMAAAGPRNERIEQFRAMVAMQEAKVEQIEDRIKKYTIKSRFDGYVVTHHVEEGAWVKTGDPVVDVIELDEVELVANVAEQHVAGIQPGLEVRVEVPSLPDREFVGVVRTVVPQADMQARTFPVLIRIKNEITAAGPLLKSGLLARVELPTGSSQSAVMIPKDAIVLGGPQPMIYVVVPDDAASHTPNAQKAVPVPVKLGVAKGQLIQVSGNLTAGQQVVVEGNERLRPGQAVVVVEGDVARP
jgi:RND family efflux transporter MFP subunit